MSTKKVCDICGANMDWANRFYHSWKISVRENIIGGSLKLDICQSCAEKLKKAILDMRGDKE